MSASATNITGVWGTILLNIDPDGEPDLSCIAPQVAALAAAGVDGVYSNGTATEFHCQTDWQFDAVSRALAEAARTHSLSFQIGASHPLPAATLARVTRAVSHSPLAIQVILPDWVPLDREGAIRFFDGCTKAAPEARFVLYNPPHAKHVLSPEDYAALADATPALIGLKCGGGDADWYRRMTPVLEQLSVFIPGHFYASGCAAGAHGAYSNMACLSPSGAVRWAKMAASDHSAALDLERRIAAFMAEAITPIIARGLPGYVCDKAMAAAGGWTSISARMMWPYSGVSPAEIARIRTAAKAHIPDFLDDPFCERPTI